MIPVGLNVHADDDFRAAAYPLFEANEVDIAEYSFDTGWSAAGEPQWLAELIDWYSSQNSLLGHGVHFSALSARFDARQQTWLDNFTQETQRRKYLHISEHFGFMTAGSFHDSAPLPVPMNTGTLQLGRERLRMLAEKSGVPIGLENLAFAFGRQDVDAQGQFLDQLLGAVDGFLLLDLHNIYCQQCNFGVPMETLLASYPLHRVRELHVSGGSWSRPQGDDFRRDTHDGPVPDEIFEIIPRVLKRCPNVRAVIFERLGGTLPKESDASQFREDYQRIRQIVQSSPSSEVPSALPKKSLADFAGSPNVDAELLAFQTALLELFWQPLPADELLRHLREDAAFQPYQSYIAGFDPRSVEVAAELVKKWGRRSDAYPFAI